MCDHPLEDKWGERPATEVFTLYKWDGKVRLDPEGSNSSTDIITIHCVSCSETETVSERDFW